METRVPELFSKQRCAWLLGMSRRTVDTLVADGRISLVGELNQVPLQDVEAMLGRKLTAEDWTAARDARHAQAL